ncbi:MAG: helix-turn-helix domain-containing protein [Gemmatimonadales bacterium]
MSRTTPPAPLPVTRALRRLGADIRAARLRRRLRAAVVAERARISAPTLTRVERGDAAVSLGIYATVLWALGLLDDLAEVAAPTRDVTGQALDSARLPQRVRRPRDP